MTQIRPDPVFCSSCSARFPVERFETEAYEDLQKRHHYEGCCDELQMLQKVGRFYERHPEAVDRIRPDFVDMLESDDPKIIDQLCDGVPFAQIKLPSQPSPVVGTITEEDAEAIAYLENAYFDFTGRFQSIVEVVAKGEGSFRVVNCPECAAGELRLDDRYWDNPNAIA